jgi:hypothetical protein
MKEKLKIGLLLDNYLIQAWEYKVLERIINSDFGSIELLFISRPVISSGDKKKGSMGRVILKFHERLDKILFKNGQDYSRLIDSSGLLKGVNKVGIKPGEEGSAELNKLKLDIILNLGTGKLNGDILNLPGYGIWSYQLGKNEVTSGYREVVQKKPVTGSAIEILFDDHEKPKMIFCSWESTYGYSINVNRNKLFWRASLFIPRIMNGLYLYGESYLTGLIEKSKKEVNTNDPALFKSPTFFQASFYLLAFLIVTIRQTLKKIFYTDAFNWMLLFQIRKVDDVFLNSFSSFIKLKSSKDKFWADPFIINRKSRNYVFVEELIYKTRKGHISVIELDNEGNFLGSEKIIDKPYHLSYPFIFEVNDCYYMIPESSQNKTIELYKCSEFPYKWEFSKNLMENLSAVDTTLFLYNNKWWLFTCIDGTGGISGGSTELFLFYSDDPFSDNWKSHQCNPIISDVRKARPAGKIFVQDGKIYRPSQDCSVRYGKGFNFNQITLLTENEYEEKLILKVEPEWNKRLKGSHTFNFDNNFTIIDTYAYRSRISV